ncbi:DUF4113 domain-containing protein [Comamonas aquatica]|uniref:DUF4113 domain-containing protein n=1 Tax=Comamonas aquatica TaxID=225991 RepID=UPI003132B25A
MFAHTSPFRPGPRFNKSSVIQLHPPTADTTQLVSAAAAGVQKIYESGYELAKAGVLLMDLCSGSSQQQSDLLFEAPRVQRDRTQLMKAMDRINARYGKATVHIASTGQTQPNDAAWRMKQEKRTPRYTTQLDEIPIARA